MEGEIVFTIDVMLARRKMSVTELAKNNLPCVVSIISTFS